MGDWSRVEELVKGELCRVLAPDIYGEGKGKFIPGKAFARRFIRSVQVNPDALPDDRLENRLLVLLFIFFGFSCFPRPVSESRSRFAFLWKAGIDPEGNGNVGDHLDAIASQRADHFPAILHLSVFLGVLIFGFFRVLIFGFFGEWVFIILEINGMCLDMQVYNTCDEFSLINKVYAGSDRLFDFGRCARNSRTG
ncbi:hypothetical protein FBQ81_07790 [Chloroflexi bacterium CFX6]|nr:hypothetical protein [Chloroflexi bacterium CFX6]